MYLFLYDFFFFCYSHTTNPRTSNSPLPGCRKMRRDARYAARRWGGDVYACAPVILYRKIDPNRHLLPYLIVLYTNLFSSFSKGWCIQRMIASKILTNSLLIISCFWYDEKSIKGVLTLIFLSALQFQSTLIPCTLHKLQKWFHVILFN